MDRAAVAFVFGEFCVAKRMVNVIAERLAHGGSASSSVMARRSDLGKVPIPRSRLSRCVDGRITDGGCSGRVPQKTAHKVERIVAQVFARCSLRAETEIYVQSAAGLVFERLGHERCIESVPRGNVFCNAAQGEELVRRARRRPVGQVDLVLSVAVFVMRRAYRDTHAFQSCGNGAARFLAAIVRRKVEIQPTSVVVVEFSNAPRSNR